jgi:hypothetical protein
VTKKAPNSPQKKRPRTGGRKPVLDPELVAAALVALSGNLHAVAKRFGVDRSAVRQLVGKRPALAAVLADCREGMKDNVESRFYADCLKDSPQYQTSRIFFLKTQCRDRGWAEQPDLAAGLDRLVKVVSGVDPSRM